MPTANPKTGSVTAKSLSRISNGTLELASSNIFSAKSEPFMRVSRKHQTSRAMETRGSELKVNEKAYCKLTKAYEYRLRANLAKAREMAVKMGNCKKIRDLPLISRTTKHCPRKASISPTAAIDSERSKLSLKENNQQKTSENVDLKTSSKTPRKTGGGISNLPFRLKENITPNVVESRTPRHKHAESQTSASELKREVLPTDAKIIQPSPALWAAILKKREDDRKRALLKEERFVPEYAKSEVNYQTNLKEFLETGTVRHYDRDFENQHEQKLKLKSTKSDDIRRALRYRPRVKTEMDLKKRLPKIEEELLRAFKARA